MTTKEQDQRPPLPGPRHTESVSEQQRHLPGTLSPPLGPCHALGHAQTHQHTPLPARARQAALPAAAWLLRQLHLGFGMCWRVHPVLPTQLDPAPISIPIILISPSPPWTSDSSAGLSSYQPTPSSQPCSGLTLCSPHTYLLRSWGISSAPPLSIPPGSVSPSLLCQRGMRRCDQRLHHIHFLPCILLLFTTF